MMDADTFRGCKRDVNFANSINFVAHQGREKKGNGKMRTTQSDGDMQQQKKKYAVGGTSRQCARNFIRNLEKVPKNLRTWRLSHPPWALPLTGWKTLSWPKGVFLNMADTFVKQSISGQWRENFNHHLDTVCHDQLMELIVVNSNNRVIPKLRQYMQTTSVSRFWSILFHTLPLHWWNC